MELPVINHEDYFAKIGDDHKFPINKFGELANYLLKRKIINHFNMNDYVDDFISSGDVRMGRPYPYMIHRIMERNNIISVKHVAKVGDTRNDVLEGKNAGCGLTIAGQTGAGSTRDFLEADMIVDKITNIDMVVDDGFFL